jgi:hypothetical protein
MAEYRVNISMTGLGAWVADSPVFDTIPEAEEYARGLASRGTLVRYWRVVPTGTPTDEQVNDTERTTPREPGIWHEWQPGDSPLINLVGSVHLGRRVKPSLKTPLPPKPEEEVHQ